MVALSTRTYFDGQLEALQQRVLQLAGLVESQLKDAVQALELRSALRANRVVEGDKQINECRYQIEEDAYAMLAMQSPNARDMRRIVSAVSIVTNLERMGDHAANIGKTALQLANLPNNSSSSSFTIAAFREMADQCERSLHDAMTAMLAQDSYTIRQIIKRDSKIDVLHLDTYHKLVESMSSQPNLVEESILLIKVSHDLERFGDRIGNICDRLIYWLTGLLREPHIDDLP